MKVDIANCVIEGRRNNVFMSVVNGRGLVLERSVGNIGCKNYKKKTFYGAELLGKEVGEALLGLNILRIRVFVKGRYKRQEKGCVSGLMKSQVGIDFLKVMINYAHNGVRFPKRRRKRYKRR